MQVPPSVEKPEGPYPTYVEQDGGRVVPVVQVSMIHINHQISFQTQYPGSVVPLAMLIMWVDSIAVSIIVIIVDDFDKYWIWDEHACLDLRGIPAHIYYSLLRIK